MCNAKTVRAEEEISYVLSHREEGVVGVGSSLQILLKNYKGEKNSDSVQVNIKTKIWDEPQIGEITFRQHGKHLVNTIIMECWDKFSFKSTYIANW